MDVDVFGLSRKNSMKIIRVTPGLGNQMFQYAFILNYKLKEEKIVFDLSPCEHSKKHNSYELERIFGIKEDILTRCKKIKFNGPYFYLREREITFFKFVNKIIQKTIGKRFTFNTSKLVIEKESENEFNFNQRYLELKGDKYISGYFCSPKYFEGIKDQIKNVFSFPEIIEEDENNYKILQKIKNSESISIHVRRGDYVGGNLDVCGKEYFSDAFLKLLNILDKKGIKKENINIFIFSDDVVWCKNNLTFLKDFATSFVDWNKKQNSYKDMQLMSGCKYNIISNSTFSWWGAYLNKNREKIIIAPRRWFKNVLNSEDRCNSDWFLV